MRPPRPPAGFRDASPRYLWPTGHPLGDPVHVLVLLRLEHVGVDGHRDDRRGVPEASAYGVDRHARPQPDRPEAARCLVTHPGSREAASAPSWRPGLSRPGRPVSAGSARRTAPLRSGTTLRAFSWRQRLAARCPSRGSTASGSPELTHTPLWQTTAGRSLLR